jgi:hypothetical protein
MARYTAAKSRPTYTFDAELEMKDAGLVAASAAATVDSAARILNVGAGLWEADVVIDITAVEIASNDERYDIIVQGSTSSSFASVIDNLAQMQIGALEVTDGDQDGATGRFILPVRNELNGVYYPYLRLYTVVAGAVAAGINYSAYAAPRQ